VYLSLAVISSLETTLTEINKDNNNTERNTTTLMNCNFTAPSERVAAVSKRTSSNRIGREERLRGTGEEDLTRRSKREI